VFPAAIARFARAASTLKNIKEKPMKHDLSKKIITVEEALKLVKSK
jgi:hypothetical protein